MASLPTGVQVERGDPVGPSTAVVDLISFARESKAVMELAERKLREWVPRAHEPDHTYEESVQEMFDANTAVFDDAFLASELVAWHMARMMPGGAASQGRDDEDGSVEPDPDTGAQSEALLALTAQAKDSLPILAPIEELPLFVRKTRVNDYNTLGQARPSAAPTPPELPPTSLASIVVEVQFYPVPRGLKISVNHPIRGQTLVMLASTTLAEFQQNIIAGGDAVPVEDAAGWGEDEDDEDTDMPDWERAAKTLPKWTNERRVVGSCFAIEGVIYGDVREGIEDYSEKVIKMVEENDWTPSSRARSTRARQGTAKPVQHDYEMTPEPPVQPYLRAHADRIAAMEPLPLSSVPKYTKGTSMQETRIGEVDFRVGEPYWYLHQGNCEHVWSVTKVRHLHASDPPLEDPLSSSTRPYPFTTFLSKITSFKCRICDRDTGSIVTLEDDLTGEHPSFICGGCFTMLHDDNPDQHVKVVPTLVEY